MKIVGAFEAKNTLGSLLDLVEKGEEVTITRHGKPVARLVSSAGDFDREKARQAAEAIRAISEKHTLGGISIRELIDEGRR